MASGTVRIEGLGQIQGALNSLADVSRRHITDALEDAGDVILEEAKATSAFADRSGKLRKSMQKYLTREEGENQVIVSMGLPVGGSKPYYAVMIEFGTPSHRIPKKRSAKTLKFPGGGFAKHVTHPGIPALAPMRKAADNKRGAFIRRFTESFGDRVWLHAEKRLP